MLLVLCAELDLGWFGHKRRKHNGELNGLEHVQIERMLTTAEQFARRHGCTTVESHVDPSAVGFYERCGLQSATNDRTHVGTLLMTKALTRLP